MTYGVNLAQQPGKSESMSLHTGVVLRGRYEIVRSIKSGGMGSVCEAVDTNLASTPCAIKEILDSALAGPDSEYVLATFENEMRALVALDHWGIPKVRDFFQEGDKRYIVMDFVKGRSLDDEIKDGVADTASGLPAGKVVADILALLDIVEYLHRLNPPIIHRDIKPANILRDSKTGRIKLVDFGLAKAFSETLTPQTMVGTMGYCPPEQLSGKAEKRSDLYAVGATLYHMLTGRPPQLTFEPLRLELNDLRPGLEAIVARATAVKPSDRYASAADMALELRSWQSNGASLAPSGLSQPSSSVQADSSPSGPIAVGRTEGPTVRESASQGTWVAVAGLALGVGLLTGKLMNRPDSNQSPAVAVASPSVAAATSSPAPASPAAPSQSKSPAAAVLPPKDRPATPSNASSPPKPHSKPPSNPTRPSPLETTPAYPTHQPGVGHHPSPPISSEGTPAEQADPPSPSAKPVASDQGYELLEDGSYLRRVGGHQEVITLKTLPSLGDFPRPGVREHPGRPGLNRGPGGQRPGAVQGFGDQLFWQTVNRMHFGEDWEEINSPQIHQALAIPGLKTFPMQGRAGSGFYAVNMKNKKIAKVVVRPLTRNGYPWDESRQKVADLLLD